MTKHKMRIGIIGGGPSSLYFLKKLFDANACDISIDIFETTAELGNGMPYSARGANPEHVTNVSGNEISRLHAPIHEWIKTPEGRKAGAAYDITAENFNDYKVLPRLFFGEYLKAQYEEILTELRKKNIDCTIHFEQGVSDIVDEKSKTVTVKTRDGKDFIFDKVIICTGHVWPQDKEGKIPFYFDSPYPPAKLKIPLNCSIALRGSSLTAIDALRTLARQHGTFTEENNHMLSYRPDPQYADFKMTMHSKDGLLPSIRFHLEDPHITGGMALSFEDIDAHIRNNEGFLSLDFLFEKDFKEGLKKKRPGDYALIKDMSLEDFVDAMLSQRKDADAFTLFKQEYAEAERSIDTHHSIYWKEMLAGLSFALNYPAKHLSAEDMLRLQKVLAPLIAVVIAFVPQTSCREMIALHDAGLLDIVSVDADSEVKVGKDDKITYHYKDKGGEDVEKEFGAYVDCVGQRRFRYEEFLFPSLLSGGSVSQASVQFRSAEKAEKMIKEGNKDVVKIGRNYFLNLPGIAVSDHFQIVDQNDQPSERIFMMAVPYMSGHNPDYSGLDFGEEASNRIVEKILG